MPIELTRDLISPAYYADPYYQTAAYQEKLAAARDIEAARQSLQRKEATQETLAYARFLSAVENDATLSHGKFKSFAHDDAEISREHPFLVAMLEERK